MKHLKLIVPLILSSCALAPACAATQTALEDAARVRDEARLHCDAAISTLREVESAAPLVCGVAQLAPESSERSAAERACDKRAQLTAAVRNVELACGLIGGN